MPFYTTPLKRELDDDLIYSPLTKGARGLFLLTFLHFLTITIISILVEVYIMFERNNKGFTLIEVLLAVSLLGIALIPIVQAMPGIYRINRDMIIENKMSFFAQDQLEMAKSGVI
jgi:prepilin-type N-terminal cleavage/methylation domain-containing protein